jgi:hypothetical protein
MACLGTVVVDTQTVRIVQHNVSSQKQDLYGIDPPCKEIMAFSSRFETVSLFKSSFFRFLVFILAPYRAIVSYNRDRDNHPFLKKRIVTINGCDTATKRFPAQHKSMVLARACFGTVVVDSQTVRIVQHNVSLHKHDLNGLDAPCKKLMSSFFRFETVFLFNSSLFIFLVFILAPYRAILSYRQTNVKKINIEGGLHETKYALNQV